MRLFGRGKTDLDKNLAEALSKEQWGCPNSLLQEIAIATEDDTSRMVVLKALWSAIEEKDKMWKRIYKGLVLAEVILKRGSVRIIEDLKQDIFKIQKLKDHRIMEGGKDVAGGIREKANYILEMLGNPTDLNQERHKNYELYSKFQGVGTELPDKKQRARKLTEKAAIAAEAADRQREVDIHLQTQEFIRETRAPENQAVYYLRRNHGNVKKALEEYNQAKGLGGYKPRFAELRQRCDQVQMIAEVSEKRAMELLEKNGWDVERAIEAKSSINPQEDSGSDSDSSSSSSDEGQNMRGSTSGGWGNSAGMGGWPGSPTGGMSSTGGWPGSQSSGYGQGGFNQSSPWPQGGAMQRSNSAGPTYGGFGGTQPGNAFGGNSPFGGKGGASSFGGPQGGFGNQQGGFGGQQKGNFGGGFGGQQGQQGFGTGPGTPRGGIGGQQGGFGSQQAGFGGQQGGFGMQGGQKGGFGGQQGGFGGGFGGQQQGGFGSQKGGFGGQQGGFGGQQGGFGGQQNGFGGQQGGFGVQQSGFGNQQGFGGQPNAFGQKGGFGGGFGGGKGGW